MPNYQEGKIYEIVSDDGRRYIGSTTVSLEARLASHKCNNDCSSKEIIETGNYKINLLLEYPCNSNEELLCKEAEYIRNTECINNRIPGRTIEEKKIIISERGKLYYQDNKEKIKNYRKQYCQKNKEKLNLYYQNNKEAISKRRSEKIECDICNKLIAKSHISTHKKNIHSDICLGDNLVK